ncbi:response regulator transcription factor [Metabacillus sp. GX 13764]|uniref:response regulator transcription factor n=1 Tax=Metabacillus kandeliae TaxID=2900151 RepID=UPI001E5C727D|nr:response regulator transcription factor [Metabacillus kandeliae]
MKKILVVEDELSIRSFVSLMLKKKGYEVWEAETGERALQLFGQGSFDLVLLDLMLPNMDGFEVCREIRKQNERVGIIMLTAKTQEKDRIDGLITGADDYLGKPFSLKELEARIFSLLRRMSSSGTVSASNSFVSGPFELDAEKKRLLRNGMEVKLTPTEFSLLHFLIKNGSRVFTRDELLDEIWGLHYAGDVKVVDVNVRRIRQKIEADPSSPDYLCTEWGRGYAWMGNVNET